MKIKGFVTVKSIVDCDGKNISTQQAVDYGWVKPIGRKTAGWGFDKTEIPLSNNLVVDNCRQYLAYLFGGRTPASNFSCSNFGIGTGTRPPNVGDTDLQSPLAFYTPPSLTLQALKPINGIDFPAPFISRVEFTISASEANGTLITEFGLYANDTVVGGTLLCRKTIPGIPKSSSFSPTLLWRLRL